MPRISQDFKQVVSNRSDYVRCSVLLALLLWQTPGSALDITRPHQKQLVTGSTARSEQDSTETRVTRPGRSQWQLSEPEWQRYLTLMQGIRGSISPDSLSPLEVLGIHAESAQERKQYARRWAQLVHEDVERTLAFQRAYAQAASELYGKAPLFDATLLASLTTTNKALHNSARPSGKLSEGDRLLIFIKAGTCESCTVLVQQALEQSAAKNVQVDFYFTDTREPDDNPLIIAWAKQQQLDTHRLAQKTLTLNHDKGTLFKVSNQLLPAVPAGYLLRQDTLQKWIP